MFIIICLEEVKNNLRIKIWQRRAERGISLTKLEKLTGIPKSSLNRYENNQSDITLVKLEKIAAALKCKISDLYESDYELKIK